MRKPTMTSLLLVAGLISPALAWAHPGHGVDSGFLAGALHPFTGMDHLLGIVAAGLLIGWLPRRSRWFTCAAFLGLLGATHAWWLPEGADGAFMAGLLAVSASLIAAGMAATKLIGLTAGARRSRT